jgi:type VI secretion system FHA domain protein
VFIDDPERFISQQHCRVDFADGQFWVTDQSTNGTFLNDARVPLPKGQRQALGVGDRLRLGRFGVTTTELPPELPPSNTASLGLAVEHEASPLLDPPWALPNRVAGDQPSQQFADAPRNTPGAHSAAAANDTLTALLSDLIPGPVEAAPRFTAEPDRLVEFPRQPREQPTAFELEPTMPADAPPIAPVASPAPPPIRPSAARASAGAVEDMVAAIAAEVVRPVEAPEPPPPPNPANQQAAVYVPNRLAPATVALAAFWCGLGVMPSNMDPTDLANLMAEFGAALREASDGFASLLASSTQAERAAANPFVDGRGGMRRLVDRHGTSQPRLDDAVREVFMLAVEREDSYVEAVRSALLHALRSMTPRAVEERFSTSLRSRRTARRSIELLELMRNMEAQLLELAEAQFNKELSERMRPRVRKLLTFERGGLHP